MRQALLAGGGLTPWMLERLAAEFRVLPLPADPGAVPGTDLPELAAVRVAVTSGAVGLPAAMVQALPGLAFIANFGNGTFDEPTHASRTIRSYNRPLFSLVFR